VTNNLALNGMPTSLSIVWAGGVDFLNNLDPGGVTNDPLLNLVITNAMNNISNAVADLHAAGAHTIMVPNLQDISKIPMMNTYSNAYRAYISGKVAQYNSLLTKTLNSIRAANPGLILIGTDIYTQLNNLVANPAAAGFTQATVDALDDTNLANKSFTGPGSDYVFWDPRHPTSLTHGLIADWIYASQESNGPISLNSQRKPSSLILSWTNSTYVLQAAPAITNTFTNVPNATSPFTNPVTGPQQFFRLMHP
jgi:phospholipase/lecithinase/hemolysin